jgi:hypothetical protein
MHQTPERIRQRAGWALTDGVNARKGRKAPTFGPKEEGKTVNEAFSVNGVDGGGNRVAAFSMATQLWLGPALSGQGQARAPQIMRLAMK